jgi:hypothetical protein
VYESEAELDALDALLERSLAGATSHLRSIIRRPGERTLTARQLADVLSGMCLLAVSTVTATGEPRVSAVDAHFLHGCWVFGNGRSAASSGTPSLSI